MPGELSVAVTDAWRGAFPGARVGVLAMDGVVNPASDAPLEAHAREVEWRLRERFAGADRSALLALPAVQAYVPHYRAFGQNYHVMRQLESVVSKGRPLASPSALVLAMFAVEIETLLLTAGHDLDCVELPLAIDASVAGDRFVGIGGRDNVLREGDMVMRDADGIISAVVYGPDERTQLTPMTTRAMFTVYAPVGVSDEAVSAHLHALADNVRIVAPTATLSALAIVPPTD